MTSKSLMESKTFWGIFLAWVTQFLAGYGIQIEEVTAGTITTSALVAVFSALALWGRYKAQTKIDKIL